MAQQWLLHGRLKKGERKSNFFFFCFSPEKEKKKEKGRKEKDLV